MKKKRFSPRILALLLVLMTCVSLMPLAAIPASAATHTNYFRSYGYYTKDDGTLHYAGSPETMELYIYGSTHSSGETSRSDGWGWTWDTISLYYVPKNIKKLTSFTLKKNGVVISSIENPLNGGSAEGLLYSSAVDEGYYQVAMSSYNETTSFFFFTTKHWFHYNYSFYIDRTEPVFSGMANNSYTNQTFTISVRDALSPIYNSWGYTGPDGMRTHSEISGGVINPITIPAGSPVGWYSFKAADCAGNTGLHSVYYDNIKPTGGEIYSPTLGKLSGPYTNSNFRLSITDKESGIDSYEYKAPSSNTWQTLTDYSIMPSAADGLYQLRAKDKAGNYSDVYSITLDSTKPTGTLYSGTKTVTSGSKLVASSCRFLATDNLSGVNACFVKKPGSSDYVAYTNDTTLNGYGAYSFKCTDNAGNTSTVYTITLAEPEPEPLPTYTISYNANGGSNTPASQVKTQGVSLFLTSSKPTRTGYTFKGWSTSSSSQTVSYAPGDAFTGNANTTLFAVWEKNTYTVSYYANGGSGEPVSQKKYYGTDLPLSSIAPTRSGYTFRGWATSSTSTAVSYHPGNTFTGNYNLDLYAVWEKNPEVYTITYHVNGGTGSPASQSKTENVDLRLSSTIPTRQYHNFLGWADSASATMATYVPGDTYTQNAPITLYAVWEYAPETYTVRFNANGGSGAPSAQTKSEDATLSLSSVTPKRLHYTFLGWSTSSLATVPEYYAGGSYASNRAVTMYAVWQKDNYDLSVSDISVVDADVYRYSTATVKVRVDNWDKDHAYSNIPVDLYYGGRPIGTQIIDLAPYGVATVTFRINVGDAPGNHTLEARVNWADHDSETNTTNNTTTGVLTVKDYEYEVSPHIIDKGDDYHAGTTAITSFTIDNDSEFDITPDLHNSVVFQAYYYNGTQKIVLTSQQQSDVVIPKYSSNLVYFKWNIPQTLEGTEVFTECTVNANGTLNEANRSNNTITTSKTIQPLEKVQTPNTRYEEKAPNSYARVSAPARNNEKATWTEWEYENGEFVLKKYGVQISAADPSIAPVSSCTTATLSGGKWSMKSGYGIDITYTPSVLVATGYSLPDSTAFTAVQNVYASFPEYKYQFEDGKITTLDSVSGRYLFPYNTDADGNGRIHFTPVYVEDGDYYVAVTADEVWTPIGVISAVRTSNPITIEGTIYDDYYQ